MALLTAAELRSISPSTLFDRVETSLAFKAAVNNRLRNIALKNAQLSQAAVQLCECPGYQSSGGSDPDGMESTGQ